MDQDRLQEIWGREGEEQKMSKAEIQAILQPHVRKNALGLTTLLWVYVAVVAVTLVLEGMNLYGLRSNLPVLTVQVVMTLLTLTFLAYGIHLIREVSVMDRPDQTLVAITRRRFRS